ncbi:hypothetical protein AAC723_27860 (plasmid) [Klebsiella pneumoniae]
MSRLTLSSDAQWLLLLLWRIAELWDGKQENCLRQSLFKELTGKSQISSNDLRKVDLSYDPFVRGEATKAEYLRAIDILIESRGEVFYSPLSWSLAVSMFPELQNRVFSAANTVTGFMIKGRSA